MKETWLKIKGYEDYEVSDMGRVRSLKFEKVKEMKPRLNKGYLMVTLFKNGKMKQFYVHRLVAEAFIGDIPKGMVVNHLNEIKTDNRLANLEICSVKQNINYGTRNERTAKSMLSNTNARKQLQLTNARTSAKYTFSCSCEASVFFGYKSELQIGTFISRARKRGEKFIKIKGEKHYFVQCAV